VGARYRDTILSQGGQDEEMNMVRRFLGREPSNERLLRRDHRKALTMRNLAFAALVAAALPAAAQDTPALLPVLDAAARRAQLRCRHRAGTLDDRRDGGEKSGATASSPNGTRCRSRWRSLAAPSP
jgi:hypothetical protein